MEHSTRTFEISEGEYAGIWCSYCNERIRPRRDEDTGAFIYQCTCDDAQKEIALLEEQRLANEMLEAFYEEKSIQMRRSYIERRIHEHKSALAELEQGLEELETESIANQAGSPTGITPVTN